MNERIMAALAAQDVPLAALAEAVSGALGDDLVGLYLYGSIVSGGFDPGVSDVDLVAVTSRDAAEVDLGALDRIHRAFVADNPAWHDRLEVVYIGRGTLRDFRTSDAALAVISPGEPFHLTGPVRDWLQNWYLVRETGVALVGEATSSVFPAIAEHEFVSAIAAYAEWLANRDLAELSPGALAYSVLSMCRALRTVRTHRPSSKQAAAAWVKEHHERWTPLIEAALRCRLTRGASGFDEPDTQAAARALIDDLASEISRTA